MEQINISNFEVPPSEATKIQKQLKDEIVLKPFTKKMCFIAGADVSFNKNSSTIYAGFVVLEASTLKVIESVFAIKDVDFPYIPGFLSFREIPPLLLAWEKLVTKVDVVVVDGHGIAHPRRMGIAAHLGLLIQKPTIGCAKNLLVGTYDTPDVGKSAYEPLIHKSELIGTVLRTKNNVKPVFVSPGHLMDVDSSRRIILRCDGGYRLPEPTRRAHLYVNEIRRTHNV